ncbi:MAG: hypothetical protein AB7Q23_00550 [Hyphomonadaceae bacterium]
MDFLANINWAHVWAFANQPFVCALVPAAIAAVLAQRVNKVVLQNEASLDAIRATAIAQDKIFDEIGEDAANVQAGAPTEAPRKSLAPEDVRRLDEGAALIQRLKDHVEKVAADARDGRKRRKYRNIARHDYRVLILSLAEDGAFSQEDAARLNHAFSLWRRFKSRRTAVPDFVLAELKDTVKHFGA